MNNKRLIIPVLIGVVTACVFTWLAASSSIVYARPDTAAPTVPGEWRSMGFAGTGVVPIAFSPNYANDQTIIIGTLAGVYRSTDKGASWTAVNPTPLGSLTFSPNYTNDHTIYATEGMSVYRSTDSGNTWNVISSLSQVIVVLTVSPNYIIDHTLFAGTLNESGGRVYRSTDSGLAWTDTGLVLTNLDVHQIVISPDYANDHTVFTGVGRAWNWYNGGVYRSIDHGNTWAAVNTGLTYREVGDLAISPDYKNDHTLFVTAWFGGVFKSTDRGDHWIEANTGQPNRRLSALAISPDYANDQIVFLGTWGEYGDGGAYVSTDRGASWNVINTGLTTRWIHRLSLSPTYHLDHVLLAGGEQANGGGLWIFDEPLSIIMGIDAPSSADVGDLVYVPVTLTGAAPVDDLRGVQFGVRVSNPTVLAPASDQSPRMGNLFPTDSLTYTVAIPSGWDFMLTAPVSLTPVNGNKVIVELPFYAQSEGCVDLTFAGHLLTDSNAQTVNHRIGTDQICLLDQGNLTGITYLQSRLTGHYSDTLVTLEGARGTYSALTDVAGNFTLTGVNSGVYTATITHPLFVHAIRTAVTITGGTTTNLPEVGQWAGDMNQDGDVDEPDWYICAAASIPVDDPAFDINDDAVTNIIDCTLLGGNIGRPDMPYTNPPRTGLAASTQEISGMMGNQSVGTVISVPQVNGDVLLRLVSVNGRIYATGTRLDLPADAIVTGVALRDGFVDGFLSWHQDNDKLYIVTAPREDRSLARDTDIGIIHLSGGSGGQVIIEDQSPVGKQTTFPIYLPVVTRR